MRLLLVLCLSLAARASGAGEIDPKFGFEPETRGIVGELAVLNNTNVMPFYAWGMLAWDLAVTPTFGVVPTGLAVASLAGVFYGHAKLPVLRRWQAWRLPRTGRGILIEPDGHLINGSTGFYVRHGRDSYVTETETRPATVTELRENEWFIDETTFNRVNNLGARAAYFFGSGHIHLDRETAFGDARRLRNFIVDLINTPALYAGPLTRDRVTSIDPRKRLATIREVIDAFDRGEIWTYDDLVDHLIDAGLSRRGGRGCALALRRSTDTLELRFPRAPRNAREMILWAELFKARLNYLKHRGDVPLAPPPRGYRSADAIYRELRAYVTDAGLDWAPYREMLPRRWRWYGRHCEAELAG